MSSFDEREDRDEKFLRLPWGWQAHSKNTRWMLSEVSFWAHEFFRGKYSGSVTLHFQDGIPRKTVPAPSLSVEHTRDRMMAKDEDSGR